MTQTASAPVWLGVLPSAAQPGSERPADLADSCQEQHLKLGCSEQQQGVQQHHLEQQEHGLEGRCLLLVLSGSYGRRRILRRLVQAGCTLACYAMQPTWAQEFVSEDHWILGPIDDAHEALQRVRAWLRTPPAPLTHDQQQQELQRQQQQQQQGVSGLAPRRIDGVLCIDEYGLQLAASLADALGLPFTRPEVMEVLRNKRLFRQACQQGGVRSPRFTELRAPLAPEDRERVERLGMRFPMVVKPAACAGSFSVTRVDSWAELEQATRGFFEALPRYLEGLGLQRPGACAAWGSMVLEEFITGHEVDIDCVVSRGELLFACVSDNHPCEGVSCTSAHAFVERGGRCPSHHPLPVQAELLRMASQVVGLWGKRLSGVVHLEAFSTPHGPVPIELNARVGGAETYTNVLHAWGLDLGLTAARIALGLPALGGAFLAAVAGAARPAEHAAGTAAGDAAAEGAAAFALEAAAVGAQHLELDVRASPPQHATAAEPGVTPLSEQALQVQERLLQVAASLQLQQEHPARPFDGTVPLLAVLPPPHTLPPINPAKHKGAGGADGDVSQLAAAGLHHHAGCLHTTTCSCAASVAASSGIGAHHVPSSLLSTAGGSHTTTTPSLWGRSVLSGGPGSRAASSSSSWGSGESAPGSPVGSGHASAADEAEGRLASSERSSVEATAATTTAAALTQVLHPLPALAVIPPSQRAADTLGVGSQGQGFSSCDGGAVAALTQNDGVQQAPLQRPHSALSAACASARDAACQASVVPAAALGSVHQSSDLANSPHVLGHPDAPQRVGATPPLACGGNVNNAAAPCGSVALARPLAHVYSVNFVPEGWEGEGVVEELAVMPSAQAVLSYVDHELYYQRGALVKLPPAGFSALGWMVARGRDAEEAEAAMGALMAHGVVMRLSKPPALAL